MIDRIQNRYVLLLGLSVGHGDEVPLRRWILAVVFALEAILRVAQVRDGSGTQWYCCVLIFGSPQVRGTSGAGFILFL